VFVGPGGTGGRHRGMVSTLREAVHELVTFDRIFEPPTATRDYYDEKCGHFGALYDTLRPVSARYQK
jgi:hypothetical protein